MVMSTASRKAKGRKLQQWVRDAIIKVFNLSSADVRSTSMGASGEDVTLSESARKVFPFSIECKSRASFVVYKDYKQAMANTSQGIEPLLIIKANNQKPLAIVDAEWFINRMKYDN